MALPKKLYVHAADEMVRDETFYFAVPDIDDLPDDARSEEIGVYILKKTRRLRVRKRLRKLRE